MTREIEGHHGSHQKELVQIDDRPEYLGRELAEDKKENLLEELKSDKGDQGAQKERLGREGHVVHIVQHLLRYVLVLRRRSGRGGESGGHLDLRGLGT